MDAFVTALVFGAPFLASLFSTAATTLHVFQEVTAEPPVWEYLGIPVSSFASGFLLLLAFAGVLVWLGVVGYVGGSVPALLALAAVRLADAVFSHILPWLNGRRPNPGLTTVPLCLIDAGVALTLAGGWV